MAQGFFASLPRNASRLCLCAMNFSDDEDFFARAGEDEDELLPFEGYECNLPPAEMLPPDDDVILEPEQTQKGSEVRESSQPGQGSTEPSEEPSPPPSRCSTETASPASSSSLPALPLQTGRGRKSCIQLCWVIVMDWPELQIAEVEFDCSERKSRRGHLLFYQH